MAKVKIHKDVIEDIEEMSKDEVYELYDILKELEGKSIEEILENSEPIDFQELKKEEPEVYKKLMKRINK